jgi:hypothetical protein
LREGRPLATLGSGVPLSVPDPTSRGEGVGALAWIDCHAQRSGTCRWEGRLAAAGYAGDEGFYWGRPFTLTQLLARCPALPQCSRQGETYVISRLMTWVRGTPLADSKALHHRPRC